MSGGHPERYESAVDRAIREAQERGEFDDLPGKGKPLPGLGEPVDDLWWVRGYIRREGLTGEDLLPETLLLRRELERLDDTVAGLRSEQAVRDHVRELNRQIVRARIAPTGPPVLLRRADVEAVVTRWRASRPGSPGSGATTSAPDTATSAPTTAPRRSSEGGSRARSWWPRRRGSRRRGDPTES